jgi:hypothetical protein
VVWWHEAQAVGCVDGAFRACRAVEHWFHWSERPSALRPEPCEERRDVGARRRRASLMISVETALAVLRVRRAVLALVASGHAAAAATPIVSSACYEGLAAAEFLSESHTPQVGVHPLSSERHGMPPPDVTAGSLASAGDFSIRCACASSLDVDWAALQSQKVSHAPTTAATTRAASLSFSTPTDVALAPASVSVTFGSAHVHAATVRNV